MSSSKVELWLSHPVLASLGPDICEMLAQRYPTVAVEAGETLTEQGLPVDVVSFLLSGAVRVYQKAPDGREILVRLLEAPAVIGDAEAIQDGPHARSSEAIEECEVVEIPAEELKELLDEYPGLMRAEMLYLSGSCCAAAPNELAMLTSLEQRVANVLLSYARRYRATLAGGELLIDRHLTLRVISQAAGGVWRSVGLALKSLRDKGLIERRGDLFVIINYDGLKEVAAPLLGGLNYRAGMPPRRRARARPPSGEVEIAAGPSGKVGQQIIVEDEVTIGCHPEADLLLDDPSIGPKHARVFRGPTGNRYWIQDLHGEGTRVNGESVRRSLLRSGDRIQIGNTQLVFRLSQSEEAQLHN